MGNPARRAGHDAEHIFGTRANPMLPPAGDLIRVGSRRWFLQTGVAGLAGLGMADLLRRSAAASPTGTARPERKAVILFWLSGGPSHIGMRAHEHREHVGAR